MIVARTLQVRNTTCFLVLYGFITQAVYETTITRGWFIIKFYATKTTCFVLCYVFERICNIYRIEEMYIRGLQKQHLDRIAEPRYTAVTSTRFCVASLDSPHYNSRPCVFCPYLGIPMAAYRFSLVHVPVLHIPITQIVQNSRLGNSGR